MDEIKKIRADYQKMEERLAESVKTLGSIEKQRAALKTASNAKDKQIKAFQTDAALAIDGN